MSTDPMQSGEPGPELQSLEADESVPPRPEEDVADAAGGPHRTAEERTHPDDVVGPLSALPGVPTGTETSTAQPYPPSPAPADGGPDSPSAELADPDYSPPDYPDDVDHPGAQG